MKVARAVAEVLAEHTTLTLECIDRMSLNVYVPLLQRAAGAAYFFRKMRGAAVPSSALMAPMTQRFVDTIKSFAARNGIEIVSFRRGERQDDRTRQYLRNWTGGEGVLYIGKAQEKARVVRTERRHDPVTGDTYPWLVASTGYEYRVNAAGSWKHAGTDRTETVDDLTNGAKYSFEVRAVNEVGPGPAATVSDTPATVPDAPAALTLTVGDGQLAAAWVAPASDGGSPVTGYRVQWRSGREDWDAEAREARATTTAQEIAGLSNGV